MINNSTSQALTQLKTTVPTGYFKTARFITIIMEAIKLDWSRKPRQNATLAKSGERLKDQRCNRFGAFVYLGITCLQCYPRAGDHLALSILIDTNRRCSLALVR
jgi:hypothetical protein